MKLLIGLGCLLLLIQEAQADWIRYDKTTREIKHLSTVPFTSFAPFGQEDVQIEQPVLEASLEKLRVKEDLSNLEINPNYVAPSPTQHMLNLQEAKDKADACIASTLNTQTVKDFCAALKKVLN